LIDRTIALAALAAIAACGFGLWFRVPAVALLFERGSFTPESTRLVAAIFLGLGPSLVGWSLFEIASRALFSLDRPWPPVFAVTIPILLNVLITLRLQNATPERFGMGASIGLIVGFLVLFAMLHSGRGPRETRG
jgi:peptidoglycan biosynthesis protein MviN/MurJ (putative lipid II flippase)